METPSFVRRITRSQAGSASSNNKHHEASLRSRVVFQDITNDSPVSGVAGEKNPLSSAIKNGALLKKTPGSGETLLRGQAKNLLEKVGVGADVIKKLSNRQSAPLFTGLGLLPIAHGLLGAPPPANTPQILTNFREKEEAGEAAAASVVKVNVVAESVENEKSAEFQECVLNRDQLFDFFSSPNESEASDIFSTVSSSVTYQGSVMYSSYDDNWSIQATASACTEDEEEEECDEFEEDTDDDDDNDDDDEDEDADDDEEEEDGGKKEEYLDGLCEGLRKITVEDNEAKLPEFTGRHTRFIYNSD